MTDFRQQNILPNCPAILVDRIELDGDVAVIADVTSVDVRVFQYASLQDAMADANGTEVGSTLTTLAAACMFDTPQNDGLWKRKDATGYNLKISVPAARFPKGGYYYRIEEIVQPSAGGAEAVPLVPWILYALPSAID